MGLVAAAGIGGVASIAGSMMSANAAKKAGDQQASAMRESAAFTQGVYGDAQTNLQPYIGAGQNALAAVSQLYGLAPPPGMPAGAGGNALDSYRAFTQTPFYQFPFEQGIEAMDRSAAKRGLSLSPGTLNALQKYGQGAASSNFSTYIGALSNLANLGADTSSKLAGHGGTAGGQFQQQMGYIGNAQAAGTIGAQNQINNALSMIPQTLGMGNRNGSSYGDILGRLFSGDGAGNQAAKGIGNVAQGYSWDGMSSGTQLNALSAQAAGNIAGGAAGL